MHLKAEKRRHDPYLPRRSNFLGGNTAGVNGHGYETREAWESPSKSLGVQRFLGSFIAFCQDKIDCVSQYLEFPVGFANKRFSTAWLSLILDILERGLNRGKANKKGHGSFTKSDDKVMYDSPGGDT